MKAFRNLELAHLFCIDLLRRIQSLEQRFEGAFGAWKGRHTNTYYREIINTKEMLDVIKETVETIVKGTSVGKGFRNWWFCSSSINPVLQDIPMSNITVNFSSLKDQNGKYLPSRIPYVFVMPILENDRSLENFSYSNTSLFLKAAGFGQIENMRSSFLVMQYEDTTTSVIPGATA